MRNVLIAAGNSGDPHLVPLIEPLLRDASPLVRAMAAWALAELAEKSAFEQLAARFLPGETDPDVIAEWQARA